MSIHAARVPLGIRGPDGEVAQQVGPGVARAFVEPPHVDAAAALLSGVAPHAVVYAFTSSSYVLGADADAALKARLEGRTGGVPVVVPTPAAVVGLRALGARQAALIHPPWFPPDLDRLGTDSFRVGNQDFFVNDRILW